MKTATQIQHCPGSRREQRHRIAHPLPAIFLTDQRPLSTLLLEISRRGLQLSTTQALASGTRLLLLTLHGTVSFKVVWSQRQRGALCHRHGLQVQGPTSDLRPFFSHLCPHL